jgi:DNA-binding NarL/FixJ family response regulator
MASARAKLGKEAWKEAFAQGKAMSAEEATEYALLVEGSSGRQSAGRVTDESTTDPLTAREREVAAMLARGLTNRRIAQDLYLSERTIEKHVSKTLRKLDLSSRTEIASWATEQRLLDPEPAWR